MVIYVVKEGDNVDQLAEQYGVPVIWIIEANQLVYPYALTIGQSLLILTEAAFLERGIFANGFAYPFISPWVLRQTLPYLSELSVFSYGFTAEGELIIPKLPVDWMVDEALTYGTSPILTLTPFGPDGNFNNQLIHQILANDEARNQLIREIYSEVLQVGYRGVNIDFEFILAEDREAFTEFVQEITNTVEELGGEVTVCLAPKTSADQKGVLYEGKDYPALGNAATRVFVMTYEWGYTYGPPMAVAPLNKVRQVLDYAVSEIPANKITMGIPNYGYDWTLPYVRGESRARTIGNIEAVQLAIENQVPIRFDEVAQSPYFHYVKDGVTHEVWFEDARSIYAKYNLLRSYPLYGFGCWQIMRLFRPMWLLMTGEVERIE